MTKTLSIVLSLCALVLTGALLFVCWKLSAALDTTRQAAWNVSALAWNSQPTVQHVNEATDVWAKASQKQADAADELIRDLRVEAWHLDKTMTNVNAQMDHVGPLLDSLRAESDALHKTTDAATGTLTAATETIQAVNDGTGPLLDASRASVKDFDALLKNPNIPDTISNVQAITQNTAGVTLDLRKVTDKATADYLTPKPWYRKVGRYASDAFDFGALLARHY